MEAFEEEKRDGFCEVKTFKEFIEEKGGESSSSSDFFTSENTCLEEQSHSSSEESSSPPLLDWLVKKAEALDYNSNGDSDSGGCDEKPHLEKQGSAISGFLEVEMMKEKFAKLLIGEDMSCCGNGVSTSRGKIVI